MRPRLFARACALVAGISIVVGGLVVVPAAHADSTTAAELPGLLVTQAESASADYDRDLFEHWVDADSDGCNTRYEVLIDESTTALTVGSGCTLTGGTWLSLFDNETWTDPSDVDIDHMVPLAEAWRSGASSWTDEQREAFANDLDVDYALIAVTDNVNQSKSDRDPAQWMPPSTDYYCQYAIDWALVKYRWSLTTDAAESAKLSDLLSGTCGDTTVTLPAVAIEGVTVPTPTPTSDVPNTGGEITTFPAGSTRLSGIDRYRTAIEVSQRYAPGVDAVFIATGTKFPDALSGAAAAALLDAPLLLTAPTSLHADVQDELLRLQPERIYVLGDTNSVSDGVATFLERIAPVTRYAGIDRYATGIDVVNGVFETSTTAFIATGAAFPDALAATGAAGKLGAPVILVNGARSTVGTAVLETLTRLGVTDVVIAGSSASVSTGISNELSGEGYSVSRYGGIDRYDTTAQINTAFFDAGSVDTMFLAVGTNFPDALAGAALAGRMGAPMYITQSACLTASISTSVAQLGAGARVILGDTNAVSTDAANQVVCVKLKTLTATTPRITGTAQVKSSLKANIGTWTSGATITYQWYANGSAISGAKSSTYTLATAQQGKKITVKVTGSKSGYTTASRTSAATATVAAAPVVPTKPANPGDTKNCSSFSTWSQAQAWHDKYFPYYGDVARLDGNNDGVACESLPGAP